MLAEIHVSETTTKVQSHKVPLGPRRCIGNEFALMEATLVLVTVAQQYRLHLVPGRPVEPYPIFTLWPRHGMLMTLHPGS